MSIVSVYEVLVSGASVSVSGASVSGRSGLASCSESMATGIHRRARGHNAVGESS